MAGTYITNLPVASTIAGTENVILDNGTTTSRATINNVVNASDKVSATNDYVVEQGTSGIWTYRKWNSGVSECWGLTTRSITSWTAWGSLYSGNPYNVQDTYPTGLFKATPMCNSTISDAGGDMWLSLSSTNKGSSTKTPCVYPVRATTYNATTYTVSHHAIGRWK